jgi:hypothetical protein
MIREHTLSGVRAAKASGKVLGRPARIFRRDALVRLQDEGLSWRAIAKQLDVPVSTAVDAYKCTEMVPPEGLGLGSENKARYYGRLGVRKNEGFAYTCA